MRNDIVIRQREYDGKWMKLKRVKDFDNTYSYTSENGHKVNLVPDMWIVTGVYDYMIGVGA